MTSNYIVYWNDGIDHCKFLDGDIIYPKCTDTVLELFKEDDVIVKETFILEEDFERDKNIIIENMRDAYSEINSCNTDLLVHTLDWVYKLKHDQFYMIEFIDKEGVVQKTDYLYGEYIVDQCGIKELCDKNQWYLRLYVRYRDNNTILKESAKLIIDAIKSDTDKSGSELWKVAAMAHPDPNDQIYKIQFPKEKESIMMEALLKADFKAKILSYSIGKDIIYLLLPFDITKFKQGLLMRGEPVVNVYTNPSIIIYKG